MRIENVIRGDNRNIEITFKQASGAAYDLADGTVTFTVDRSSDPSNNDNSIIQKVVTSHIDAENGVTMIQLSPADTEQKVGDYWYDAQLVDAQGNVVSKLKDRFQIVSDITR
jgi:hypothetical protein